MPPVHGRTHRQEHKFILESSLEASSRPMAGTPVPTRRRRSLGVPRLGRLGLDAASFERRPTPDAILEGVSATAEVESRDRMYRRMLAYADVLSAAIALILCTSILGDDSLRPTTFFALPLIVAASKIQ